MIELRSSGQRGLHFAAQDTPRKFVGLRPRFDVDLLRWRLGDRLRPDVRITFDVVNRYAAVLARDLRFEPNMLFKLPTSLATVGATVVRGLFTRSAFGTPMDPTGLVGLETTLVGLKPEAIAASRGFDVQVVSGILEGVTIGSGALLDRLEIGGAAMPEANIDRLAAQPDAHFGAITDAFDSRLRDLLKPRM